MDSETLRQKILEIVKRIDAGGIADARAAVLELEALGWLENIHVYDGPKDSKPEMSERGKLEWYGGQIVNVVNTEAWWAMNSIINACHVFVGDIYA